jgi:hypothetical protein
MRVDHCRCQASTDTLLCFRCSLRCPCRSRTLDMATLLRTVSFLVFDTLPVPRVELLPQGNALHHPHQAEAHDADAHAQIPV